MAFSKMQSYPQPLETHPFRLLDFSFKSLCIPPWRVAQAPLFSHQVKPFLLSANLSWAARAASGTPLFPTPALQRAAESQGHPGHIVQQ